MDTLLPNRGDAVSLPDLKRDTGALNPQPESPGRWRLDSVGVPEVVAVHDLQAVAGGLNPQPLPPGDRFSL